MKEWPERTNADIATMTAIREKEFIKPKRLEACSNDDDDDFLVSLRLIIITMMTCEWG
jgi:hypothetical protein